MNAEKIRRFAVLLSASTAAQQVLAQRESSEICLFSEGKPDVVRVKKTTAQSEKIAFSL
jgi:hypothetical protein